MNQETLEDAVRYISEADVLIIGGTSLAVIPIKAIEFRRISPVKSVAQNRFRRIVIFLVVQSVYTPKIRNAALGRNPRAAEKNNVTTAFYNLIQLFYFTPWRQEQ